MSRHGENIHYRKDGRWEARVLTGESVNGKNSYKYLYGSSYLEVKRKKQSYFKEQEAAAYGLQPPGKQEEDPRFEVVADAWLNEKKKMVKESTFSQYVTVVKTHLLPALGDFSCRELTPSLLERFLNQQREHGKIGEEGPLSPKTVYDLRAVLVQILNFAGEKGLIQIVPECPSVASRPPAISVLTKREQKLLESTIFREKEVFTLGLLLSLYGGLRIGEVCGLRWEDFDAEEGTVQIRRTLMRIADVEAESRTKVILGKPKTESSVRTVPLPLPICTYLLQFQKPGDCYILTGTQNYMEPRVCRDRFGRMLKRIGIRHYSYHTLRHTYATRCIENGMDVKSLSEMMGHADVKITMQRYVHPTLEMKKEQINQMPILALDGQVNGHKNGEKP